VSRQSVTAQLHAISKRRLRNTHCEIALNRQRAERILELSNQRSDR